MAATTRPLTLGEILDRTVQLYRHNFLLFLGISAAPAAVNVLLSGGLGILITSQAGSLQTPAHPGTQAMLMLGLFALLFLLFGVPVLLGVFAVAFGALNRTAYLRNRGEATSIREAYAYSFRFFWRHLGIFSLQLFLAGVIPGLACGGILIGGTISAAVLSTSGLGKSVAILFGIGAVLLVIAVFVVSILIWIRFCLAFPVSATEQIKAWPSLKRSNFLSQGTRGRIFVMYLLVAVLTMVVYYTFTAPMDIVLKLTLYKSMEGLALISHPPLILQIVNLFISFLERAFVMPIYAIALLLFYNDQRMRHEGYDIELLMDQAGWSELAPAAFAAPLPPGFQSPTPPAAGWGEPPSTGVSSIPGDTEPVFAGLRLEPPVEPAAEPALEATTEPRLEPPIEPPTEEGHELS